MVGKKEICLRVNKNGRAVDFSTAAAKYLEDYTEVEIYEKDTVVAIQATLRLNTIYRRWRGCYAKD